MRPGHDGRIGPEDVVVSLRFSRPPGAIPAFRLLHVPGAGLDGIDMASVPPGAAICNVFEHEIPIAEYVALAMLEWQIRLRDLRTRFTAQRWSDLYRSRPPHAELYGKTLLLIGLGRIGGAIATRAAAFGMRVLAVDGYARPPAGLVDKVFAPGNWNEALPTAEFVVISCPLTEDTRGMFNAATLARMRRDAVLINVSRAEIRPPGRSVHRLARRGHRRSRTGRLVSLSPRRRRPGRAGIPAFPGPSQCHRHPAHLGLDHGPAMAPIWLHRREYRQAGPRRSTG